MNAVFWFRRDLRLEDNTALAKVLSGTLKVIPLFIFDTNILDELPPDDARLTFIYRQLQKINAELRKFGSGLLIKHGDPQEVWKEMIQQFPIKEVYFNKDYEPYAIRRDEQVKMLLAAANIPVFLLKDQVVFEESEVMKPDGECYTVFTPYKNKWLQQLQTQGLPAFPNTKWENLENKIFDFPPLETIGFSENPIPVKEANFSVLGNYEQTRNLPALEGTSNLSVHLRFGTISIREVVRKINDKFPVFLSELIWREFFMQILFHYPRVVHHNFRAKYDGIQWRNNEKEFERWCRGETGYPMVDAGMRELNETGYMHNRVRMVTASFLCKHLLIDWRWGEAYFAKKLLDYELSSNNGNWQWAAGTGCDAAPYFRIFNPSEQQKKFDKNLGYIKRWIPELDSFSYPTPMVEHTFARQRALAAYQRGIIK
ncbi:deoxyribodipyrimidine photo-lyase [Maribellus sp. CM-23]|uniref:cryptochrome/photolyase family protein n=1 Tax=Maribellus sp. CM-23 TaxID=2781026 RepID=UPI001F22DD92|nr:deoxyribodipyrimidine photo-lyase [Maribellus sp. CM-23]MCE4565345.1 deoxyribodipyrimidine photo-lyase [Maribellus sp. CM-23]